MSNDDWSWARRVTDSELEAVTAALDSLRTHWQSTYHPEHHPDFGATFVGTLADVAALDWLWYEQFGDPPCGVEGAALICGEALRRAAGFEWVVTPRGDWFVAQADSPRAAICPLARVQEVRASDCPQFNKHVWVLQSAAFMLWSAADPLREPALREILEYESAFLDSVSSDLRELRPHQGST